MDIHLKRELGLKNMMTPNGKTFEVVTSLRNTLFELRWKEGGELPAALKGNRYTGRQRAEEAARSFLAGVWNKEVTEYEKGVAESERRRTATAKKAATDGDSNAN